MDFLGSSLGVETEEADGMLVWVNGQHSLTCTRVLWLPSVLGSTFLSILR